MLRNTPRSPFLRQAMSHLPEIPVRVFQRDVFVENLSITDFEIYEDGVLQKVQAVYLVKETDITREESQLSQEKAMEIFAPSSS